MTDKKKTDLIEIEKIRQNTSRYVASITEHSTFLLMVAVIAFFITNLFGFYIETDYTTTPYTTFAHGFILGSAVLGSKNLFYLANLGGLFAVLNAILMAIVNLCAGLSFAAVCFDERKNIWFRVVSVAALMLIIYGGLQLF